MVLNGAAAIVAGASGSIGAATARMLAENGVSVTLTGRRTARLAEIAAEIARKGGRTQVLTCDLHSENEINRLFKQAHLQWGRLDIVVNCAGFWAHAPVSAAGVAERWREMLMINVLAATIICREAVVYFNPELGGHIVNIGSTSGHRVRHESGFYAATKFALRAVTEALRMELASSRNRTRVTLISPGGVLTEPVQQDAQASAGALRPESVAEVVVSSLRMKEGAVINDVILRQQYQVP